MKPDLGESLLRRFDAPIFDDARGEEATRAMPVRDAGFRSPRSTPWNVGLPSYGQIEG
jgi:hypothetical protein